MMRHLTAALGLAVLVCAIGAVSASAEDFKVTSVEPGALKGKQVAGAAGEQRFLVEASHEIVCKKATVSGLVYSLVANDVAEKVAYAECTAFGFIAVTVPEAEYEVGAEGEMAILQEMSIKIESGVKCTVKVKPQAELGTVAYSPGETLTKKLEIAVKAIKVETEVSGGTGSCGKEGKDPEGKFTGTDEVEVEGAEIATQPARVTAGDCVRTRSREGSYKDAGCTMAEVKGDFNVVLCRELTLPHLTSFSESNCMTRSALGKWYLTLCNELLPATHDWSNNTCTTKVNKTGAWELLKI